MVTRAALHRTLVEEASLQGIPVRYGKRLASIEDRLGKPIVARFEDGTTAEGECIIGADGIRSQVRQSVMPTAPKPVYTGLMAPGGFSPCIEEGVLPRSTQRVHFIFGQKGFFGHFNTMTANGPRTVWWSTFAAPLGAKQEMERTAQSALKERRLTLHGDWAAPVPNLIASATDLLNVAIHDVPTLANWSAGRTLLIGDAAHAVAPHSGQGASMALEDAQFLAKLVCESQAENIGEVFRTFEISRRPRTDKVIALGRRNGQRKEGMSPLAYWIQQRMIRIFVSRAAVKKQDWLLGYRVEGQPAGWSKIQEGFQPTAASSLRVRNENARMSVDPFLSV